MLQDSRISFGLARLAGRLHRAAGDKRCGCGQCAWWVALAANAAGVSRQQLEDRLPPPARSERKRRPVRPMTARIGDAGAFRVRGAAGTDDNGILLMLSRLHQTK